MEDVMENDDASPTSKSNATIRGATSNSASKGVQDFPCSQGTVAGGDRIGISMHNILKGVLMMNRVLSCRPKIMPFVRQFYELYALTHFTVSKYDLVILYRGYLNIFVKYSLSYF